MRVAARGLFLALSSAGAIEAGAQTQPPPADAAAPPTSYPRRSYVTQRAEPAPPKIDGILDDACWERVEWASDFVQFEPTEGQAPTEQTAFKIVYDETALYIAYRAFDREPESIARLLARRDRFPGDWVEINIDSYLDRRTAFSFTSSVSGVRGDEFVSQDGNNWDPNWDPVWQLETQLDAQGWTAEVRVPLSQLRFADRDEQVWGIQVTRRLFRKEERSLWQPKSKSESGWVSRFGELRGIRGIRTRRPVELLPYTVGRGESFERVPGNPFRDGRDTDVEFGLDGKVGITSDLTADFTVNPDFGQVEADPSEVNLTAFETRFEEKRPFFIEGNSILSFQIAPSIAGGDFTSDNLFYSRRIGRPPRLSPSLSDSVPEFADVPTVSSIRGAAKLTGRTRHGLSMGVLESMTGSETAEISGPAGRREQRVEPFTNYLVGRAQQDFAQGNTQAGAMVTALHRDLDANLDFLHRSAYSGGVDVLHRWHDKTWYAAANGAVSQVRGEPRALRLTQTSSARYFQRPDNDYEDVDTTRAALTGHAGSVRLGKSGGQHVRCEGGVAWRSPGFEINDVGFMRQADQVNEFLWGSYVIPNPVGVLRRFQVNGNQWLDWDFGGKLLSRRFNLNFNTHFKNNWYAGAGATRFLERTSNTVLRGGPSARLPGLWASWFWVDTDSRKPLSFSFGADFQDGDEDYQRFRNWWVDARIRPSNALQITASPSYSTFDDALQYIAERSFSGGTRYVLGEIEQETAALTLRVDYALRPNLTVQFYGAPFVSAGSYGHFKRVTEPHGDSYADRYHEFRGAEIAATSSGYAVDEDTDGAVDYGFPNRDFNFRDFNSNLVVRWEFMPGSVAFLVWSQARSDEVPRGGFALDNDVRGLFDVHPHDVFLLKVSRWFAL
jgi:hypothetical protein